MAFRNHRVKGKLPGGIHTPRKSHDLAMARYLSCLPLPMRILLYEGLQTENLSPVALVRPVFELVCGRDCLRRRLQRWFPTAEFGVWIRSWLKESYAEEQPEIKVNDRDWLRKGPVLLINGRWLPERRLNALDFLNHRAGYIDGHPAWILGDGEELAEIFENDPEVSLPLILKLPCSSD